MGREMLCEVEACQVDVGDKNLLVLSNKDVTAQRQAEHELRELNAQLEAQVDERTEDLAGAIRELSQTRLHLRHAQSELVQAEKLAALGSLVAGIARELSTPWAMV